MHLLGRFFSGRRGVAPAGGPCVMESLEPRVMLDASLPSVSDLVDPRNTVVRVETNLGEIDFELFDVAGPDGAAPAPITTANFLSLVQDGDFFESFFHRSVDISSPGTPLDGTDFVLQGGGFTFTDEAGLGRVPTDDPIENEFDPGRSNVERSVAMALITQIGLDTATSQFFINLQDNDGSVDGGIDLDAQSFTVFARVVDDRSWSVVQAIVGLETFVFADALVDENGDLVDQQGNPTVSPVLIDDPESNPTSLALTDVPVRSTPPSIPPGELRSPFLAEEFLVSVSDTEVIKPAEAERFFTFVAAHPEGFVNDESSTFVDISTSRAADPVSYQVILRYETGVRDQVIATGTLNGGRRDRIVLADPTQDLAEEARKFTPFAIEVQATGEVTASLTHTDFGATLTESFIDASDVDALGAGAFTRWDFAGLSTTSDDDLDGVPDNVRERQSFLVWQNLTDEAGTVTITLFVDAGQRRTTSFDLEGNRRGGAELHNLFGFTTQGVQGIRVDSTVDIVAALSTFDTLEDDAGAVASTNAFGTLGVAGGARTEGIAAGVTYTDDPDDEAYVSLLNPTNVGSVVTLTISDDDGNSATTNVVLGPLDVGVFDLQTLESSFGGVFTPGEFLTLRYDGTQPTAAQFVTVRGDEALTSTFQTQLSDLVLFAGGFDPQGSGEEVLSLANPYATSTGIELNFVIQFFFVDRNQTVQFTGLPMLEPGERTDIRAQDLQDIAATIGLGEQWQRYTLVVAGIAVGPAGGTLSDQGQFAATLTRVGPDGRLMRTAATATSGSFDGTVLALDDGVFDGAISG